MKEKKHRFKGFLHLNYRRFFKTKKWRQEHITVNGYTLIIFLFISALLGLDISKNSSYHIFSILFSILIISIVHSKFFNSKFNITRILPKYGTVNQELIYNLRVENLKNKDEVSIFYKDKVHGAIPSLEEFINIPEPDEEKRNIWDRKLLYYRWLWLLKKKESINNKLLELPAFSPKEIKTLKISITPLKRGELNLSLATLAKPDIFNMFNSIKHINSNDSILVLPKRYVVKSPNLDSNKLNSSEDNDVLSITGQGNEFFALRDYRDGDNVRNIHWKSWAKRGKPVIKEYQKRSFPQKALILDVFGKNIDEDIFETSISIASSFISPLDNTKSSIDEVMIGDYKQEIRNNEDNILIYLSKLKLKREAFRFYKLEEKFKSITGAILIFNKLDQERIEFIKLVRSLNVESYIILSTDIKKHKYQKEIKEYNIRVVNINNLNEDIKEKLN